MEGHGIVKIMMQEDACCNLHYLAHSIELVWNRWLFSGMSRSCTDDPGPLGNCFLLSIFSFFLSHLAALSIVKSNGRKMATEWECWKQFRVHAEKLDFYSID
jgi:hypothetical protein